MNEKTAAVNLPVGAKVLRREPVTDKSFELAEQLALRGASEALVRAIGGAEAVEKLMGSDEAAAGATEERIA